MSNELKLFLETMQELKATKPFNLESDPRAGKDFNLVTNTHLLNPTFYIHEVFAGERLVDEIIFDRFEQKFYIRDSNEMLSKMEVIQHVKRGLIGWVVGRDFEIEEEILRKIDAIGSRIDVLRNGEYTDFVKVTEEILLLPRKMKLADADMHIEYFEAESPVEELIVLEKYKNIFEEMFRYGVDIFAEFDEMASKIQGGRRLLSKLIGLFQ